MSSPRANVSRRALRWLLPAALLALTPKCVLCVLAYVGAGAALGIGGPEWCRAEGAAEEVSWITSLAWFGTAGVAAALGGFAMRCRKSVNDRSEIAAARANVRSSA